MDYRIISAVLITLFVVVTARFFWDSLKTRELIRRKREEEDDMQKRAATLKKLFLNGTITALVLFYDKDPDQRNVYLKAYSIAGHKDWIHWFYTGHPTWRSIDKGTPPQEVLDCFNGVNKIELANKTAYLLASTDGYRVVNEGVDGEISIINDVVHPAVFKKKIA